MAVIGYASLQIIPSLRGLQAGLSEQLTPAASAAGSQAGDAAGKSFASRFKPSLAGIASAVRDVTVAALGASGALAGFGVKGAASLEQTTVAFTSLLGSSKAATDQIAQLQQFAAATPFSQQDVFQYAQQFFALAGSVGLAKDQVQPFLTAIGDVASVTGASTENIHNAVMAIGQIGSSGKVTLDNLNQISEAFPGFNAAAAIAKGTGQTTAQVLKEIGTGSLDAKTGVQALILGMQQFPGAAGAMAKQSQTLTGLFSTFKDTVNITLTQAFQPLIPVIKQTLATLTPVIASTLQALAPVIAQLTTTLAPVLGPLVSSLGQAITAVMRDIEPLFTAIVPIIGPLTQAFVALAYAVSPLIDLFARVVSTIGPPLLNLFTQLVQAITPVANAFVEALAPVIPVIAQSLKALGDALAPVVAAFAGAFALAMQQIAPLLPQIATAFTQMALALIPIGTALINAIMPVLPTLAQAFTTLFLALQPVITALAGAFVDAINSIAPQLPALADAFGKIAVALAQMLTALVPLIKPLAAVSTLLLPALVGALTAVAPLAVTVAHAITGLATAAKAGMDVIGNFGSITGGVLSSLSGGTLGPLISVSNQIPAFATNVDQLGASLGGVIGQINGLGAADLSGIISQMGNAAGIALGLANNLGMAAGAAMGLGGQLGASAIGGLTGSVTPPTTVTYHPPKVTAPKAPAKPPFDPSTLTGLYQAATGTQTNPLTTALNAVIKSAKDHGTPFTSGAVKTLRSENADLEGLVKQRDQIATQLSKAQDALKAAKDKYNNERSTVRSATVGTFDITTAGKGFDGKQPVTFDNILAQVKQAATSATAFGNALRRLAKEGLSKTLLQQLAEAGPQALPQALALLQATPKQIGQLNAQYNKLGSEGSKLGAFVADDLYGAGVKAAQGLVNGLTSQESALKTAVRRLAAAMVNQIRASLGIHSPSRVLHSIGVNTAEGFRLGIASMHGDVAKEAQRLSNAAIPASQVAAWSARPSTGAVGGDIVVPLVIDGREIGRAVLTRENLNAGQVPVHVARANATGTRIAGQRA